MTPTETTTILRQLNAWRRLDKNIRLPDPRDVGRAIDAAVEMIDRLEEAEKAVTEAYRRGDATGQEEVEKERDAARDLADRLALALNTSNHERDNLRAKIAEMEQQEPVVWMQSSHLSSFKNRLCGSQSAYVHCSDHQLHPDFKPLYALPGAQEQEPTRDWWDCLIADISAIDCMYRGSPTYAHDAYWMRDHVVWMLKKRRDSLLGAQGND